MQCGRSKRSNSTTATKNNGIIAGSVWESRMKFDEVKGGIKVFNGESNSVGGNDKKKKENTVGVAGGGGNVGGGDQSGSRPQIYKRLKRNQSGGNGGEIEKIKRTWKSEIIDGNERNPIQLRKTRSDVIEKNSIQIIKKPRSEESRISKDFGIVKDKMISSSSSNVDQISNQKTVLDYDDDDDDGIDGDKEDEVEEEEEDEKYLDEERINEIEDKKIDVKEVNVDQEQIPKKVVIEQNKIHQMSKELVVLPISSKFSKKSTQVLNDSNLENPYSMATISEKNFFVKEDNIEEHKPKKTVIEENKFNQIHKPLIPISSRVIKEPTQAIKYSKTNPKLSPSSYEFERFPESQNKLQNIVDLVLWKDVSKSTFVFGFGTFVLLSSSFTKDLNFSLISAISYMGLLYLATRFLYRSIICRGDIDFEESNQRLMVGEEEAIWLLKLILPYLNEFLLKLRSLFSGDPATTMKLAVLLFILARCGSSITIWKVAKLGFFGVFTVPKVCSSYSTQLTGYGKFWINRFRDAWDSCSHKKAVALGGFTLVWNLSSIVARIWAVFMLVVAVRYYQQSLLLNEGWGSEEVVDRNDSCERHDCGPTTTTVSVVGKESKKLVK